MVLVKTVVPQFIADIDQDKKETGNTNGQSEYVQNGIIEMFQDIPDGNDKYMAEHTLW
jgi:hypothetical protein